MSDDWYSGDDNGSSTGWSPSCDICFLLYSIKSTVEGNSSRLTQIQSAMNNLLPIIRANFDTSFSWDYQIKEKCGDETNKRYEGNGKGIPALIDIQKDLVKILQDLQTSSCENDNFAVVPEWWQLRPEADRPQLIVQCAEKNADGSISIWQKYYLSRVGLWEDPSPGWQRKILLKSWSKF
jgi:hypothetical protein